MMSSSPHVATSPSGAALRLSGVSIRYPGAARPAVDGVELSVEPDGAVGILGESGCGKTSLARFATGMLPTTAVASGEVQVAGQAVPNEKAWRRLRGLKVGIVFQQPSLALHPMRRVGSQVVDVLRAHRQGSRVWCRERALSLFEELDLHTDHFRAYPHQLSGGQQQRVVLAQALACEPPLLVADEPTTALDRETEVQVLRLIDRIRRRRGMALLWISHDPRVLAEVAETLYVMYGGRFLEIGPAQAVLGSPSHPYTEALVACAPRRTARLHEPMSMRRLETIPEGDLPASGCVFRPRCSRAAAVCEESPVPRPSHGGSGLTWCVRHGDEGAA